MSMCRFIYILNGLFVGYIISLTGILVIGMKKLDLSPGCFQAIGRESLGMQ